ncbi:hypothetical protein WR25_13633 [Diploscapter pachys]|uniref:Uncharacterized protein n=1 Tax=Diploscapter pachys TaxID=2018661 RepID=A0A2A2M369_9BILA|nr:hypothetical protein WR25_13633 [Diploscapter pachys]
MVRSSVRAVLAAGRDQVDQIKMTMLVGDEAYQEESDGRDMLCKRCSLTKLALSTTQENRSNLRLPSICTAKPLANVTGVVSPLIRSFMTPVLRGNGRATEQPAPRVDDQDIDQPVIVKGVKLIGECQYHLGDVIVIQVQDLVSDVGGDLVVGQWGGGWIVPETLILCGMCNLQGFHRHAVQQERDQVRFPHEHLVLRFPLSACCAACLDLHCKGLPEFGDLLPVFHHGFEQVLEKAGP